MRKPSNYYVNSETRMIVMPVVYVLVKKLYKYFNLPFLLKKRKKKN